MHSTTAVSYPPLAAFSFHSSTKPSLLNLYVHSCSVHNYLYHPCGLTWTIMLLLLARLFWCETIRSHIPISHLCITYSHFFSTQVFISKTSITLATLLWSLSSLSGVLLKHVAQNWTQDCKSCVDYSKLGTLASHVILLVVQWSTRVAIFLISTALFTNSNHHTL